MQNSVSHCNRCGCKIDSGEKVTVLNHAPDAICVLCSHPIANHYDWMIHYSLKYQTFKKI